MEQPTASAWQETVEKSLKLCERARQQQQWALLAESPLAATTLVTTLLPPDTDAPPTAVGLATFALIEWAIDQLKPAGQPVWADYPWRSYLVLQQAYLAGMSFAELARKLAISEQTVFQSRRKAVAQLATILYDELRNPQAEAVRRHYWTGCRYAQLPPLAQQLLALLAAQAEAQPLAVLLPLLTQIDAGATTTAPTLLPDLVAGGCLVAPPEEYADRHIGLAHAFRSYLETVRPEAVATAHHRWAEQYAQQGELWCAVAHYRRAGAHQAAATLLLAQQRALINRGVTAPLRAALQQFQQEQVDEPCWAGLKVLAGDLAMQQQDLQRALDEYQQAIAVQAPGLRALAYHRRARAFLSLNLDEALLHYELALALLESDNIDPALQVRIQCDRAWFYIQERPNFLKATALLRELQAAVPATNSIGRSYVANAWAGLHHRQGDDSRALEARLQAWQLANATQDREWAMTTGFNVANDYVALQQYETALDYYAQSRHLAEQLEDLAMAGLIEKARGACYFCLADYPAAATHYERAYQLLQWVQRTQWLVHLCYDLAELYAQMWDYPAMRRYAEEGLGRCQQLRNHKLLGEIEALTTTLAWMELLNERQQAALKQIKNAGFITNRDYQTLTGCAQRQAVRDLNELCDLGILRREGEGRAVRYIASTNSVQLQ